MSRPASGATPGLAQPTQQRALADADVAAGRAPGLGPRDDVVALYHPAAEGSCGVRHERIDHRVHRQVEPFGGQ